VTPRNRNRLILVGLFVMFLVPVVAALLLQPEQLGEDPENTVNRGTLVRPPVPLVLDAVRLADGSPAAGAFTGRWLLLHMLPDDCDAACRSVVADLRQIHIGTGRYRDEVAILLVGDADDADMAANVYDELRLTSTRDPVLLGAIARALVTSDGQETGTGEAEEADALPGTTFIADPEGNLMLRYAPGYDRGDLNTDLKKLLKWSGR